MSERSERIPARERQRAAGDGVRGRSPRAGTSDDPRRRLIGVRHRLAPKHRAPTASPADVARSLVVLHATDPASVHLAILARTKGKGPTLAAVDAALYVDRSLVRMLAMRRTVWVVPTELVPVVHAAAGASVAANERRNLVKALEENGIAADGARWLDAVTDDVLAALSDGDGLVTAELTAAVPQLKRTIRVGSGKWTTEVGVGTRVVLVLGAELRIVRGRPRGTWISTQYRWKPAPPITDPWPTAGAQAELARRWQAAFGPASVDDLRWWAGWTVAAAKAALAGAGEPAPLDDRDPAPWAALLPGLDPTTMGWKTRDWYLGDLGPRLFDRNGNAGPAVWWNGQVVGGWAQRASGEVVTELLVDVGRDARAAIDAEAARVERWLRSTGTPPYKARFPTPLEVELRAA
jgi:hypothetical protein